MTPTPYRDLAQNSETSMGLFEAFSLEKQYLLNPPRGTRTVIIQTITRPPTGNPSRYKRFGLDLGNGLQESSFDYAIQYTGHPSAELNPKRAVRTRQLIQLPPPEFDNVPTNVKRILLPDDASVNWTRQMRLSIQVYSWCVVQAFYTNQKWCYTE